MLMIQQFEKVIESKYVSNTDTKQLWMANFLIWTTRHCSSNFDREEPDVLACGRDQVFSDNSTCSGFWVENKLGLREKTFASEDPDICFPYEDGICRPTGQMHPDDLEGLNSTLVTSWCPVIDWSDEKFSFCLRKWREINGGGSSLVLLNETGTPAECDGEFYNDEEVLVPIPISSSPDIFVSGLETHEVTLDMIKETRMLCDDDDKIHCWLSGTNEMLFLSSDDDNESSLTQSKSIFLQRSTLRLLESIYWYLLCFCRDCRIFNCHWFCSCLFILSFDLSY